MKERILVILSILSWLAVPAVSQESMLLNGQWEMGECRHYSQTVEVPGIHCDPTQMNNDTLWYRREVILPKTDASYIAVSDHWRSNVSSSLWDDVVLHLHRADLEAAIFAD